MLTIGISSPTISYVTNCMLEISISVFFASHKHVKKGILLRYSTRAALCMNIGIK